MANPISRVFTLLASATYAADATTNGSSVTLSFADTFLREPAGIVFVMDLTAAAAAADDTCDVTIQSQIDGTNWMTIAVFAQRVGNGGTARQAVKVSNTSIEVAEFAYGTAPAAGATRAMLGNTYRGVVVIAGAGAAPSFTLSLVAVVM